MAIYHLSVKPISRSAGRSATGAAAYRSAEKIIDAHTGEVHDYTRKAGVVHSEIVMPTRAGWSPSRSELWNAAEQAEKRKDACVAREHEIALPAELTAAERLHLVKNYAQNLAERHGCAVDFAIHKPDRQGDGRNWHAHVLCTTRQVEGFGLGQKCDREKAGRNRKADLEGERKAWEGLANLALHVAGHGTRIDRRTLEAQGIEREPTVHKGPAVTALERRGVSQVLGRIAVDRVHNMQARAAERDNLERRVVRLSAELRAAKAEQARARTVDPALRQPTQASPIAGENIPDRRLGANTELTPDPRQAETLDQAQRRAIRAEEQRIGRPLGRLSAEAVEIRKRVREEWEAKAAPQPEPTLEQIQAETARIYQESAKEEAEHAKQVAELERQLKIERGKSRGRC